MSLHRAGRTLGAWGCVLAACLFLAGCQSTSVGSLLARNGNGPAAGRPSAVLSQGMEVAWSVESKQDTPGLIKAGMGVVGPDGTMVLGPYGTCQVAGLTLDQANRAVEKHLSAYVHQPRVALQRMPAPAAEPAQDVAWRAAGSKSGTQTVALKQPQSRSFFGKRETGVRPAEFQGPAGKEAKAELGPPRELHPTEPVPHAPVVAGPVVPHPALPPAPHEMQQIVLPPYVIGISDVLQIESLKGHPLAPVRGPHLVRPDGTVGLGVYGSVLVAGLTIPQAKEVVAQAIFASLDPKGDPKLKIPPPTLRDVLEYTSVDVVAYNSKVFYVITDNAGQGEFVQSFPVTGNDTVLDAISKINGLPPVASKRKIWVARRASPGHAEKVLPVDWVGITQHGQVATNWQIMPGDRVYVGADHWYTADRNIAKVLSPFERIFGFTLLGSQTVNSFRTGGTGGGGGLR